MVERQDDNLHMAVRFHHPLPSSGWRNSADASVSDADGTNVPCGFESRARHHRNARGHQRNIPWRPLFVSAAYAPKRHSNMSSSFHMMTLPSSRVLFMSMTRWFDDPQNLSDRSFLSMTNGPSTRTSRHDSISSVCSVCFS